MITLKGIATETGTNMTAVSNVLYGKAKKVSPEVKKRIKKLLIRYNYILRFGLNTLINKDSKIISIPTNTPDFVEQAPCERPFYEDIIGELENILRKRRYYIMFFSSENVSEIMKMTMGWNVDGVIFISMSAKYKQIGKQTGKPITSIGMNEYDPAKIAGRFNVTSRDYEGSRHMMGYLPDQGVEKAVYLTSTKPGAGQCRYLGTSKVYRECLGENAALEIRMPGRVYDERVMVYDEAHRLIGLRSMLFFSTGFNAVEAIGYLQRRQISTPEDISVAGLGDDICAKLCNPRLTSMSVNVSRKAELAVNVLMCLIDGEEVRESEPKIDAVIAEKEGVMKVEEMGCSGQR